MRALGVALVAAQDVGQHVLFANRLAALTHFPHAPGRPHLRGRGDEDLHLGAGRDHGPDIAAIEHRPRRPGRELALVGQQRLAHRRNGRNDGRRLADGVALERRLIERLGIERPRGRRGADRIVEPAARIEQRLGDGAVEQTGIEMPEPVGRGEPLAERALAGGGRTVNGDDHGRPLYGCAVWSRDRSCAPGAADAPR